MICNHLSFTIQHSDFKEQTFLPSIIHICVWIKKNKFIIGHTPTEINKYKLYNDHDLLVTFSNF